MRPVLLLSLLVACGGEPAAPLTPGGDTLVVASMSDFKDFLSVVQQSSADSNLADNLHASVVEAEFECTLEYGPSIAKSWTFSEDGKTLSMQLRNDLTWQDKTPVTAADFAFTYSLVADPTVASPRLEYVKHMLKDAQPRVVDAHTLEWEFDHAFDRTTMLAHASLNLVPQHLLDSPSLDRASLRGHPLNTQAPVSNGPWKVAVWEKNARLVLEPNENYTGPTDEKPRLRRVVFKVLPEYSTRLLELKNGSVDLMESVSVADADMLAKDHPEIGLHRRGWRSMDYVAWNAIDPADYKAKSEGPVRPQNVKRNRLFGDKEVRKALAMAIDTDRLIKDLLTSDSGEVYARPSVGTITPALCGVHNDTIVRIPHDATAARARLAELGWVDTNSDGWIDKDGENFSFTLITNSGNTRRGSAAVILQAALKDVGIDMQIEQIESNTFFERMRKRDYEAALSGWSAALFVDPTSMWGADSEFNFTSYENPRATELMARGLAEPDPEKAAPIWKELQQVIYDDQPYGFLYWMDEIVAVNKRFENTTIDVLGPYRYLNRWSVPADKIKYKQ